MGNGIQGVNGQPASYGQPSIGQSVASSKVATAGAGVFGGDTKLQMMHGQKAVTHSQLAHRPTLLKPQQMSMKEQVSANGKASAELMQLGEIAKSVSFSTATTMVRAQLGMQTQEDKVLLEKNIKTLKETARYVDSLSSDNNQLTKSDKEKLLGGQGFDDQKIKDLLQSKKDNKLFQSSLNSKHGGAYNQKKSDLIAMGYNESQADMVLSVGDDNLMKQDLKKNELNSSLKNNPDAKKLAAMGFDEKKIKELLNLINKGEQPKDTMTDSKKMLAKLGQMGFDEKEAKVLLATGSADRIKEQRSLMRKIDKDPDMRTNLLAMSESMSEIKKSPTKPFLEETLKQQADIFMVLGLIHKMSVEQRRSAKQFRALEYDAARNEMLQQAKHMRKAAVLNLAADVASGTMTAIGGMVQTKGAGGFKGAKKLGSKIKSKFSGGKSGSRSSKPGDLDIRSQSNSKSSGGGKKNTKSSDDTGNWRAKRTKTQEAKAKKTQQKNEENQKALDKKTTEENLETQQNDAAMQDKKKQEVTIGQEKKTKETKQKATEDAAGAQAKENKAHRQYGKAASRNTLINSVGQLGVAPVRYFAKEEEAKQKESEVRQKTHENAAQSWNEWMQLQQDQIKTCLSKMDEISRVHFDTLKTLSRG